MINRSWLPLFVAGFAASANAQMSAQETLFDNLETWRAEHGQTWRVDVDEGTGFAEFLYGGSAPAAFQPTSDSEWFSAARAALAQTAALHGIEAGTLVEERALYLPLGMTGSTDKMTLRLRQFVSGVPVEGGAVNVLFDATGRLLSVQTRALPHVLDFPVVPQLGSEAAADIGRRTFRTQFGLSGSVVREPELMVAQIAREERREPVLVWKVDVQWLPTDMLPEGRVYMVDAKSGAIVREDASIHNLFDVGGTLRTKATPGVAPDSAGNPETDQLMKYARVQSSAGTVFTDANGVFNFPGATGPLNCTFTYVGTYNNVTNQVGAAYSTTLPLTGTGNSVVVNPAADEYTTAQANAFVSINSMRDWVRSINPSDATADFVHTANCNINSACNAYFNGSSTNYFIAAGGCVNSSYSTVIAHEDGHWLNVLYGTGNGFDGMGEGNADVFAMYLYDTNIVAQDFFGPGQHIRDGLNTRQFCGDCCPACAGEVHADGEVWMGAAWKIRANLNNSLGNAAGDALANALFMGWMNAYNQADIKSVIETQWLTLDDNDGNIGNGTPHYYEIDGGFVAQGFPGVPFDPIAIGSVTQLPDTSNEVGPFAVQAAVQSNLSGGSISSVTLFYRIGWGGAFSSLPMSSLGGGQWSASIPGTSSGTKAFYYVRAVDNASNALSFPKQGANDPLFFSIGNVQNLLCDSFETQLAWTASIGSSSSGAWQRGDPLGTSAGSVQVQPEFDNTPSGTLCWFTGQGFSATNVNEADVDGGAYTLTSPPVTIALGNAEVSYSYWFYNDDGDDSLLVQVSSNGVNWTTARTHSSSSSSWRQGKVDVGSAMAVGSTVYVRFSVADSPNNSATEAAIDDVCFSTVAPNGCAQPVIYCASKIDASFCAPQIDYSGYAKFSGTSAFAITLSNASTNRSGLLFYGYGQFVGPFQGGALCCQTPIRRTPLQNTGFAGVGCTGTMSFDFNAHIRSGVDAGLYVGRSCAAQYYYRDPLDPYGTALSNGVHFTICP